MIPNTLATIRTYLRSAADTRATGYATEYSYRPAEKWLKDRRRRTLSYDDITHYRRICAALAETPRVMRRIDNAINSHGGWPLT